MYMSKPQKHYKEVLGCIVAVGNESHLYTTGSNHLMVRNTHIEFFLYQIRRYFIRGQSFSFGNFAPTVIIFDIIFEVTVLMENLICPSCIC